MRFFNTEGPIRADEHYHVPPLERVNLGDLLGLVRDKRYFVLHAPRQTGKTSALLALRDLLNGDGDYRCVYVTVEAAQASREDVAAGVRTVLAELGLQASVTVGDETLEAIWPRVLERVGPGQALREALLRWSMAAPRPLVLLIDEIDTLVGDTLLSVLRQLRAGYPDRPGRFPHSVILCGVRDVRDYRIYSSARNAVIFGGSAFNIKSKSLRLGDFSEAETRALLAQHTAQTGQAFTADALAAVWMRTAGQPWLVNALCREACFENEAGRDRSRAITEGAILDAQEQLILGRVTHLDDLADKLREDRVRRVVAPMLTGDTDRGSYADRNRDVEYARDLGLLAWRRRQAHRQPDLRGGDSARADVDGAGRRRGGDGVVRGRCGRPGRGQVAGGVPAVLPRKLGALDAALRPVSGGGPPTAAAGVSAEGGQRRRPHRAGVCPGQPARGSADRVAAGGKGRASSWSSASCCTRTWSGPSKRGWPRRAATWIVAARWRAT